MSYAWHFVEIPLNSRLEWITRCIQIHAPCTSASAQLRTQGCSQAALV